MKKVVIIIISIYLLYCLSGCGILKKNSPTSSTSKLSNNFNASIQDSQNNSAITTMTSTNSITIINNNDYTKWVGAWNMGDWSNPNALGSSAQMKIDNANIHKFDFSISALFVALGANSNGQTFLNPHTGLIQGTAYYSSANDAYYTDNNDTYDMPGYKIIFQMKNDTLINIQEINTSTNQDYGYSPAGANVRYHGDYIKVSSTVSPAGA